MPNSPVHFEIPADDVARAKTFYRENVWMEHQAVYRNTTQATSYFVVTTKKPGEPGVLMAAVEESQMPGQPFTNYISVTSIDAMNQTIQANGGTIVLPKQEIGQGMGWISAFTDPDNNLMGLHQMASAPPANAAPRSARKPSTTKKSKPVKTKKKKKTRR